MLNKIKISCQQISGENVKKDEKMKKIIKESGFEIADTDIVTVAVDQNSQVLGFASRSKIEQYPKTKDYRSDLFYSELKGCFVAPEFRLRGVFKTINHSRIEEVKKIAPKLPSLGLSGKTSIRFLYSSFIANGFALIDSTKEEKTFFCRVK